MTGAYPLQASAYAGDWDRLFAVLTVVSALVVALVFIAIVGFSIRFRRGSRAPRGVLPEVITNELELGWTAATAIAFLFLFWWAAVQQLHNVIPPQAMFLAANQLGLAGACVQWHLARGMGHGIDPDGLAMAGQFLSLAFRGLLKSQGEIRSVYKPS